MEILLIVAGLVLVWLGVERIRSRGLSQTLEAILPKHKDELLKEQSKPLETEAKLVEDKIEKLEKEVVVGELSNKEKEDYWKKNL